MLVFSIYYLVTLFSQFYYAIVYIYFSLTLLKYFLAFVVSQINQAQKRIATKLQGNQKATAKRATETRAAEAILMVLHLVLH